MKDILDRLNDPDEYIDAIDDAIQEIKNLRDALKKAQWLIRSAQANCYFDADKVMTEALEPK